MELTRLSAAELRTFSVSKRVHDWGRYDGSGDPIRLTPMAFHRRFVWDVDYIRRAKAQRLDSAHLREDGELAAVAQAFPGAEAVVYRYGGSPRVDRKDARELILVGRPRADGWCLLALTHSEDTV
ncbi:MAG: hypothetical protein HY020_27050 [Burkholderiales bacterium]|nr:hypothetical protein [Burkholderiales bacterium]